MPNPAIATRRGRRPLRQGSELRTSHLVAIDATIDKVAPVTLHFWIVTILATSIGEALAEAIGLSRRLGLGYASLLMAATLFVLLAMQLRARRYQPTLYWTLVVSISIVGTLLGDILGERLGVPASQASAIFAAALAATFAAWRSGGRALPGGGSRTLRNELYYWAAMLGCFALGTAIGELITERLWLVPRHAALLLGAAITLLALLRSLAWLARAPAFWLALVVARPLGSSLADLVAEPKFYGGLGYGNLSTDVIFLTAFVALVVYTARAHRFAHELAAARDAGVAKGRSSTPPRAAGPALHAVAMNPAGAAPVPLAQAAEAALAASGQRILLIEHGGARYAVKRTARRARNLLQSLLLRGLVRLSSGQALPMRALRMSAGVSSMDYEAQRLAELAAAGVQVPRVVHRGRDYLVLEHVGASLASELLGWTPELWRDELPRQAAQLAALHRAGFWHGAAQIKNLTRRGGIVYRIDFEESFGEWVPLPAAQAFDLVLFLNSISLRGPIDEAEARRLLPALLDGYLAANPDPQVLHAMSRALSWTLAPTRLAARVMRLKRWGHRRNGVARLHILVEALAARLLPQRSAADAWPPQPSSGSGSG